MAQRIITQLISDLSGVEVTEGAGETIQFMYRGAHYSIDLTEREAAAFDKAMATYLEHGTKQSTQRESAAASKSDAKAIRAWARSQGIDVPDRGRVPSEIRERYRQAH